MPRADRHSLVKNIFRLGQNNVTAHDLLVGYHSLCVLRTGNGQAGPWRSELARLRYSEGNLQGIEERFREMNVFHQTPNARPYNPDVYDFDIHHDVVEAYLSIATNPAYLDSVAQTTPIDESRIPRMARTVVGGDFKARVETSMEFLEFVHDNETAFVVNIKRKLRDDDLDFANSMLLPSYTVEAAKRYLERLISLRSLPNSPIGSADRWWDKIVEKLRPLAEGPIYLRFR